LSRSASLINASSYGAVVIFISYFTPDGAYPALARKLQASLERFKLRADIQLRPSFGSWAEACRYKSRFILDKLFQYREAVVWMDIDTEVWKYPEMLFGEHDFAIYNWTADRGHHLDGRIPFNPKSAVLLCSGGVQKWGYTAAAIELLVRWIAKFDNTPWKNGDDPLLDAAYNEFRPPVSALWLPKTYNRMDKHTKHWAEIDPSDVVINHDYVGGRHRQAPATGS
jgi:hypothetical protein